VAHIFIVDSLIGSQPADLRQERHGLRAKPLQQAQRGIGIGGAFPDGRVTIRQGRDQRVAGFMVQVEKLQDILVFRSLIILLHNSKRI